MHEEYHKIDSVFKRDPETHRFLPSVYANPAFDYLQDCVWRFTEKIDGTNVRVMWDKFQISFGGRTDSAQMPPKLLAKLNELFSDKGSNGFYGISEANPITLYGEGYGATIQKGGGNYIPNGVDFILFDVKINDVFLDYKAVEDIAGRLNVKCAPLVDYGTLAGAVTLAREGFKSKIAANEMLAEGIVIRPMCELQDKRGHRIITKLKYKDFH